MKKNKFVFWYKLLVPCLILCTAVFFLANYQPDSKVVTVYNSLKNFFNIIELKTFDARQKLSANNKHTSKDIVIVEIDEKTYTAFTQKMGEWPVSRKVYADVIEYMQQDNPQAIGLDLLFINSDKFDRKNDARLANLFDKYDNIFTSINFDNESEKDRPLPKLPDTYRIQLENRSKYNFMRNDEIVYANCRSLISEIMQSKVNVGHINIIKDKDGILREFYPFIIYQDEYYPHLALEIARYLFEKTVQKHGNSKIVIDNKGNLVIGDKKVQMQNNSSLLLNWYKKDDFKTVSFIDVYDANNGDKSKLKKGFFKDKIIYIGATATALYDNKNTPVSSTTPGVVFHTTFLNNLIDNNFIKKTLLPVDAGICICLCAILIFAVMKLKHQGADIAIGVSMLVLYIIFSQWIMNNYNIWIPVVIPIICIVLTFIGLYVIKYHLKSKDFEYTYKLATTDGLTELYNHRFFQEQLALNIENAKRYNNCFSLIMLDIDFFKKFNDKYGHQAGDTVLRQVAQNLKKLVRSTDIACRYGGEEMTVILTNTNKQEAVKTAEKICKKIADTPFKLSASVTVNVTVSIGVSTYPDDAQDQNSMISFADKGLYIAKENGRNQVGISVNEE